MFVLYSKTLHILPHLFICLYEHEDLGNAGKEAKLIWGDFKAEMFFRKVLFYNIESFQEEFTLQGQNWVTSPNLLTPHSLIIDK